MVSNENMVWAHSVALGVIESAREIGLQIVFHEEYRKGTKDFWWRLRVCPRRPFFEIFALVTY